MKNLNNMMFVLNAGSQIADYVNTISKVSESYEKAKATAAEALGFANCMTVYLNTMISADNNDFTQELDEVIDNWRANIFQALVDVAIRTNQPNDTIIKLGHHRDNYRS